jgi:GNAT superfamily N-acetyltransferase
VRARRASAADADLVVGIISRAFATDPLWSLALAVPDGSTDHHHRFWRPMVEGALRHPWVWISEGDESVACWIPPGADEMTDEQETDLHDAGVELLGPGLDEYLALLERFDAAHPQDEPHYYLSFLATDPAHRGKGTGMALLRQNLELIDAEGLPSYLESSNPANLERYGSVGFEPLGTFAYPQEAGMVTTMWRPAR